jgi:ABC-type spermidine/putrescine transport system, permease component II
VAIISVSLVIGVPAMCVLAQRDFPGKRFVYLTFLLPILMPPIVYGIPLATVLYQFGLVGNLFGVILVRSVLFVILTMTPFIEQIDPGIERAARVWGANLRAIFLGMLTLLLPCILAAGILVRTVGMFERRSSPPSRTHRPTMRRSSSRGHPPPSCHSSRKIWVSDARRSSPGNWAPACEPVVRKDPPPS